MRPVLLLLLGLLALGFASECPRETVSPGREIVCYTSSLNVQQLYSSVCRCTTLVHEGHDLQDLDLTRFATLRKSLKKLNPVLQFVVSINDARESLKTSATSRQDSALRIVDILNEVDGIELNVTAGSKERLLHFVQTLKGEMKRKSKERRLFIVLPTKTEQLAKQYDIKALSKYVDLFSLPTHYLMDDEERYRTFHPSRLMGLFDVVNTDNLVDLVHNLGAEKRKILVSLPASGYKFTLKNEHENVPRDPTIGEFPIEISRKDICNAVSQGPWTIERDDDSTAPYAFKHRTWIAFEDKISTGIKGKYVVLRDLAGLGIRNVENDIKTNCGKTITEEVYNSFTNNKRKSREAVLTALKQDIYNTENVYPSNMKSSDFRISRIVDSDGKIHAVRENMQTEFSCPHQGYYVHPKSCNRFYRCVKFNQEVENYSIFEFDCPAGLAFDEQTSVCVWPGSLPEGSPCPGSPEIAPTTRQHFKCPDVGYYTDPYNCRWFFACLDLGGHEMRAYEFQCPYGLVFDESKGICEWPWLVPSCAGKSYEHGNAGGSSYGGGEYGKGGYGGGHGGDEGGSMHSAGGYDGDKGGAGQDGNVHGGGGGYEGGKGEGGYTGGGGYAKGGYGGHDGSEGNVHGEEGYDTDKGEKGNSGGGGGYEGGKGEGGYTGSGGYDGSEGNMHGEGGYNTDKGKGDHSGGQDGNVHGGDGKYEGSKDEGGYGGNAHGQDGGVAKDKEAGGHRGGQDDAEGRYDGGHSGSEGEKSPDTGAYDSSNNEDQNENAHGGAGGYAGDKDEGGYSRGENGNSHGQNGGYDGDKSGGEDGNGNDGKERHDGGSSGYNGEENSEKHEDDSARGHNNFDQSNKGEGSEKHDESGGNTEGGSYNGPNQGAYDKKDSEGTYGGSDQGGYDKKTNNDGEEGQGYDKNERGSVGKGEDSSGGSEKPEGGYQGPDQNSYVPGDDEETQGSYGEKVPSKDDEGHPIPEQGGYEGDTKEKTESGMSSGDDTHINYGGSVVEKGGVEGSYGKGSDSSGIVGYDYANTGAKGEGAYEAGDEKQGLGGLVIPEIKGSVAYQGGISTGPTVLPQSGQSTLYSGYSPPPEALHTTVSGGYESFANAGGQSLVIGGAPYTTVAGESQSIAQGASGYYIDGSLNPNSFTVTQRPLSSIYAGDSGKFDESGVTQSFGTVYTTSAASGIVTGDPPQSGLVGKYPQTPGYSVSNGVKTISSGPSVPHASIYAPSNSGNAIHTHQSGSSYSGVHYSLPNSKTSIGNQFYPNQATIYTSSGHAEGAGVSPTSGVGGYSSVVVADGSGFYTNQASFPQNFGTSHVITPFIPTSGVTPGNQYHSNQAGWSKKPSEVPLRPTVSSGSGYKTNEYHDNGGRGTIRYNNGVVTHKYAEDDVRDHNTAFRPFPTEEVTTDTTNPTIQRTGPQYTRGGFTKTGPTKTGITTAQVGGTGTYVAGVPLRKPASGTDQIGENAFGTAPKKSAIVQQVPNRFTGTFDQSSKLRESGSTVRPSGYSYSRPIAEFTGPATVATLSGIKSPQGSSGHPFLNIHVYNTPTVLSSAPITAAPAIVNTYSYGRPTVGQRKDIAPSAGAASIEAHFNSQVNQATARPLGYTTALDGYKSTLFEASRVPIGVSTPTPGIKAGPKATGIPVPIASGGFDYDKYSYTNSEIGKGNGHLNVGVSLQQSTTSTPLSRPSAISARPGPGISSQKVTPSVTYQSSTHYKGVNEGTAGLDGHRGYNYGAAGGKFGEKVSQVAGGSVSYQPTVTTRPQIYRRPSSSDGLHISQSDVRKQSIGIKTSSKETFNGYNYDIPQEKISNNPKTYSSVTNISPTLSTIPKIIGITNNNRGTMKYTASPYELPQKSAILSVETSGNGEKNNFNYPPPPTKSSRIPLNNIKGGFTSPQPIITTYSGKTSTPSYEIATKSDITTGSKNRGKIIVKFSDLHPVLLGKLGAECTCKADPFATFRGDRPLLVDSSQGRVDLRNYDESDVYVDLDTNEPGKQSPTIGVEFAAQSTKQLPTYLPPTRTTTSLRVAASDIDASYASGHGRSRGGKSLKAAKAIAGVDPDKIGVLELNPQGQAECARPGLFRHPKYCDKFYACHWDNLKKKFSLHIFNCPIHLTFDNSANACNWPTSGPTCQDNNILV